MNSESFNSLEKAISTSRLSSYKSASSYANNICKIPNNNKELVTNYVLNAKLSENFYFLLQNLEVSLRNAIYDSFNQRFPGRDFFILNNRDTRIYNNYASNLEYHSYGCWKMLGTVKHQFRSSRIPITDGKIISQLNFGFWTTLLEENRYKAILWRQIFRSVFPNYPHGRIVDDDVIDVSDKINKIRKFRNRIFHFEPIFNYQNLLDVRNDILDAIGWINADMMEVSKLFDESEAMLLERKEIRKSLDKLYSSKRRKTRIKKSIKRKYKNR